VWLVSKVDKPLRVAPLGDRNGDLLLEAVGRDSAESYTRTDEARPSVLGHLTAGH
jgi:hypothetical protein